ncbi:E3 ubiquitin-protein ligase znrf3 [Anabarilius grahami]|uniref:E3 ubiquitin-protein ligase znrf3 n=1 Tax=Anabarilius grahami TaxID=495550 RepID=A0A3N0XJI5_ANAGA|nr:E3 ubiquitin-protein ligase znrf3 [Anabarilius grahami]
MILPRSGFGRGADSVVLVLFWVLGSVVAKDTAFVEVVLFESSPNGDYTTYTTGLQGRFSRAGATISAEGEIVQGVWGCTSLREDGTRPENYAVAKWPLVSQNMKTARASKSETLLNAMPRGIICPLNTCLEFNTVGRSALWEVMVTVSVM